ncbi:MAG: hypothetical protein Q9227_004020 [Pyrenula ochraceoflavens]
MTIDSPLNTHFRRSQTPESPRPVHIPEPNKIPVLKHQMDPVFNDTATYDIPSADVVSTPARTDVPQTFPQNPLNMYEQAPGTQPSGNVASHEYGSGTDTLEPFEPASMTNTAEIQSAAINNNLLRNPQSNTSDVRSALQPTYESLYEPQNGTLAESSKSNGSSELAHTNIETSEKNVMASEDQTILPNQTAEPIRETGDEGVNFQTLLDNLSRSTSTAPPADSLTAPTTAAPHENPDAAQTSIEKSLPIAAGLPPRPPPQEKPSMHPNYSPNEDIQTYHQIPSQAANISSYQSGSNQPSSQPNYNVNPPLPAIVLPSGAPGTTSGNGLPPPPSLSSYQNVSQPANSQSSPTVNDGRDSAFDSDKGEEDVRWGPEIQRKYDDFLHEERRYVTEGVWDRFPPGSRLFVGNLPTEKVTKRDLFHIFHKYGKLAQISIKQAYGFVQFLDAVSCYEALDQEQSAAIRGRKIHLEVSKPQKNTRNSGPAEHGKHEKRRRSRSPGKRGGGRRGNDRSQGDKLPFSDFRDEPNRRRDDYRPPRSPSPRGFNGRDYRIRENSVERYGHWDGRRGSPTYGRGDGRYGSPRSRMRDDEDEMDYLLPRRRAEQVPDVQIIILEEVDRNFVWLALQSVIKRQVVEGVQAVIKLTRMTQLSGKIPLQVFDRSSGVDNVNFNEYEGLDVSVAAEIVIRAKQTQRAPASGPYGYTSMQNYQAPASQQVPPSQTYRNPQHLPPDQPGASNMLTNLDSTSLQKLLGALQQPQGQQTAASVPQPTSMSPANGNSADLASLLSNVARQQQSSGYAPTPTQQPSSAYPYSAQSAPQGYTNGYPSQGGQPNKSIMDQLSRYR